LAVAFSGDDLLVGAPYENSVEGAVFSYEPTNGGWSLQQTISEPGGSSGNGAEFGISIATSSSTVVVGAQGAAGTLSSNTGELGTGAAFVFKQAHGKWGEQAELVAPNGQGCVKTCSNAPLEEGGDYFGDAVAILGRTLVVGADCASLSPEPDGCSSDAPASTGTAYVFSGSRSHWAETAEVYDPPEVAGGQQDTFGFDVSVLTSHSIAVSAPYDSNATGALFVFNRSGHTWSTYPTELTASNAAPGAYLGYYGGLTGIGSHDLAIGASYAATGTVGAPYTSTGEVYIFQASSRR